MIRPQDEGILGVWRSEHWRCETQTRSGVGSCTPRIIKLICGSGGAEKLLSYVKKQMY